MKRCVTRACFAALAAIVGLVSATAGASSLSIAGFIFQGGEQAFADDATVVSGTVTGASDEQVRTTLVGSNLGDSIRVITPDVAVIEIVFSDNAIVNGPGTDLVLFELSGALWPVGSGDLREKFEFSVFDGTGFSPFTEVVPVNSGFLVPHDASLAAYFVEIDLATFGFSAGQATQQIRIPLVDNLETRSADPTAFGALSSVVIPEPCTALLLAAGLLALGAGRRGRWCWRDSRHPDQRLHRRPGLLGCKVSMQRRACSPRIFMSAAIVLLASTTAKGVTIDWVTVGDPANPADDTGFGSVSEIYRISTYEVTNSQYAEFLNAAGATDAVGLYNSEMANSVHGGITRSGSAGSFSYSVKPGMGSKPVNFVSFYDALRFANWLHNGQPTGAQDATTTEDGAYTLLGGTPVPTNRLDTPRNAEAAIFLASEDEWYKAAFHDALSSSYFDYPTGTDAQTLCAAPGTASNTANCENIVGTVTDVGAYSASASPSGTFDQGGNVWEWNEGHNGSLRGLGDGSFDRSSAELAAADRNYSDPAGETESFGFRVASIPEPSTALLLGTGLLGLGARRRLGAAKLLANRAGVVRTYRNGW